VVPTRSLRCDVVTSTGASRIIGRIVGRLDFPFYVAHPIDVLRRQIRSAFPAEPFTGPVTTCKCDECTEIRNGLEGKRWTDVAPQFLDFTCSPILPGPQAFRAFVPAYMIRALDELAQQTCVLELTVYSLCPSVADAGEEPDVSSFELKPERAEIMNAEQAEAIRAFLSDVARGLYPSRL